MRLSHPHAGPHHVDQNHWAADRLSREPGWVLGQPMREGKVAAFGAYLNQAGPHELDALRLGKKAAAQLAEAERLHRLLDRYALRAAGRPVQRRRCRSGVATVRRRVA